MASRTSLRGAKAITRTEVRLGSLYEELRQQGVPEDIAYRRQHIYNRLVATMSEMCGDECD